MIILHALHYHYWKDLRREQQQQHDTFARSFTRDAAAPHLYSFLKYVRANAFAPTSAFTSGTTTAHTICCCLPCACFFFFFLLLDCIRSAMLAADADPIMNAVEATFQTWCPSGIMSVVKSTAAAYKKKEKRFTSNTGFLPAISFIADCK